MIKVNVFEIKAKLSEYLDRAVNGERIVICRHNKPVAELRSIEEVRTEPRPIDALPGRARFNVPTSFFDPLPDDDSDLWDGGATAGTSTAAEAKPRYGSRPGRSIKRPRS